MSALITIDNRTFRHADDRPARAPSCLVVAVLRVLYRRLQRPAQPHVERWWYELRQEMIDEVSRLDWDADGVGGRWLVGVQRDHGPGPLDTVHSLVLTRGRASFFVTCDGSILTLAPVSPEAETIAIRSLYAPDHPERGVCTQHDDCREHPELARACWLDTWGPR